MRVKETDLDRSEGWFDRYGGSVIFFARMVPGARSIVSVPAGILRMPLGSFTLLTALGSALWNVLLIAAGWYLGANWQRVGDVVGSLSDVVVLVILLAAVAASAWWWRRHKG